MAGMQAQMWLSLKAASAAFWRSSPVFESVLSKTHLPPRALPGAALRKAHLAPPEEVRAVCPADEPARSSIGPFTNGPQVPEGSPVPCAVRPWPSEFSHGFTTFSRPRVMAITGARASLGEAQLNIC